MWLIDRLKVVLGKMFAKQVGTAYPEASTKLSDDMKNAMGLWREMINGTPPWIDKEDDIKTIRFCNFVGKRAANLTTLDIGVKLEGSARAETYNPVLDKLEVLNAELKKLADKYNVGPAQIPVAWAIAKGTLPIIGVTKTNHVEDAVKAVKVALTAEETAELEKIADSLELNVIRFWEKEMK